MALRLAPVTQKQAKQFIARHHRHNDPSITAVFVLGLKDDAGELVGVAMVGLPKARLLMDGTTLEVTRTCVREGTPNGNSMLYGAAARAAKALGYTRLVTYTLPFEGGASLKASGWLRDPRPAGGKTWTQHTLHPGRGEYDMFGNERIPQGEKVRWWKCL